MKFLIIQTAFPGDVILATSVAEKLFHVFPDGKIDFLVRKGNETLFNNHPFIGEVIAWDKRKNKFSNLFGIISKIKKKKYDVVVNLHRFAASGIITILSGAKEKIGYDKNPFSFLFTKKFRHDIGSGKHEIERNHELIKDFTDEIPAKPKLYPTNEDIAFIRNIQNQNSHSRDQYICIAPASVWFTKQFPKEKWIELINNIPENITVYLIGSNEDHELGDSIQSGIQQTKFGRVINLSGKLTFLQSASLMKGASQNYVNDSAPLHLASAVNAPVTAVYCSTTPGFGFGPLSDRSRSVETKIKLDCRPCGLHGYRACPKGHFKCALTIDVKDLLPD